MTERHREFGGSSKDDSSPLSTESSSPALNEREDALNSELARGDRNTVAEEHGNASGRFVPRQGEGDALDVLEPEHPLMRRFQKSLKAHLERQDQRITEEVLELDATLKKKQIEREDMGVLLYNIQQEIVKQQTLLDNYHDTLATFMKMRQDMDNIVHRSIKQQKAEMGKLNNAQKKEGELRSELESLMMLERQFMDWEEEMESELAVSQRISEKTKIEKTQLAEEKRKQDVFLYKLITEVANLESKMIMLDGQFRIKESERATIGQTVADANADLEALNREQHRLLQAWNAVVISMQQRDKVYSGVMKEYNLVQERFLTLNNEIDGIKRSSILEMEKNEKLTLILNKLQLELSSLEHQYASDEEKKNNVEMQLSTAAGMLEQTEKDLERANLENQKCEYTNSLLLRDIEKLSTEKLKIEDAILERLQEQITQNKAAKYMNKLIQQLRDKTREQELTMVNTENQYSQTMLEIERQKGVTYHNQLLLDELTKEIHVQEKEVDNVVKDLNHSKSTVCKKQVMVDGLNKKLEQIVNKSGGQELTPMELKIVELQKTIAELEEKSEKLQQFWLRQQGHIVNLSHKRYEQLQEINILRKQVLILDQKNLKIEREIGKHNKEEQNVSRAINALMNRLMALNTTLSERRGYKDSLDKENIVTQTEYINVLKDAEMDSLKLQTDTSDLEEEKVQMGETLLAIQQECLAWEKKLQMALETKQNIDKEKSKEGEIGTMKCEIHRMQVRYSQLRRAQDKLVQDLEHCVARRDAIVDGADAKEKRSTKGMHNTRVSFQKKIEDLQNKIKQVNNDTKATERLIIDVEKRQEELLEQLTQKQEQLKQLQETAGDVDKQLEEGQLHKQQNLELLVRRQRKVRMYGEVKVGHHRLLYRSEHALDMEMQKQKMMNADLISVLESLLTDFPSLEFTLTKILNTLRSQPA